MRRQERAVTDTAEIDELIKRCDCCRLGITNGTEVYVVPLSFGYIRDGKQHALYFHCAGEGRKLDMIAENARVGFEMDVLHGLVTAKSACGYSCYYESVIGSGSISVLSDEKEKLTGMAAVMRHYTGREDWHFDEAALRHTTILRLDIDWLSAKRHLPLEKG